MGVLAGFLVPIVAVFIGSPHFELNTFEISGVEFKYGIAIEYALSFLVVLALGYMALSDRWDRGVADGGDSLRPCPECTMAISAEATRCPYCTARIDPEAETSSARGS